jgi:hypothetical protein
MRNIPKTADRAERHRFLGRDRFDQHLRPQDLQNSLHVVRQYMKAHLCTHPRLCFRQEVG